MDRLRMETRMRAADKAHDAAVPEGLTNMNKFIDFELRFRNFLKTKIGSSGTSLLYVVRLEEEATVNDGHRNGTVGHGPNDTYKD